MDMAEEIKIVDEIRERYPDVNFPNVKMAKASYVDSFGNNAVINGKMVILSEDPKEEREDIPVAICSKEYNLIPHEVAIHGMLKMMEEHPEFGTEGEMEISLTGTGNSRMRTSLRMPSHDQEVKVGDIVGASIGVINSFDLSKELSGYFAALRLSCTNGVVAYNMLENISKKHRMNLSLPEQMELISKEVGRWSDQMGIWKTWVDLQLSKAETEPILDALPFGKKYKETLLALPEHDTGETLESWMGKDEINAWNLSNVVTQFVTHNVEANDASEKYGEKVAKVFHQEFAKVQRKVPTIH